jgi:putative ABC transport system substrate-binding protein
VNSLAHPGGNITGVADFQSDLGPKRLELLKAAVPRVTRVVSLTNAAGWDSAKRAAQWKEMVSAAQAMGITMLPVEINAPSEFDAVTAAIVRERPDALLVNPVPITFQLGREIAEFAAKQHLPSVAGNRAYALAGILMSYGPSVVDIYRTTATYVAKILRGAKPGDLPIEQPTKFELVINLKTAKALGLTIPPSLLGRADEVIQ